jgi:SAM-dependent methyltransferase
VTLRADPKTRFSATVDLYARHRPSYPPALFDWLIQLAGLRPGAAVADLGCGTGISTRLLAAHGLDVIGIDPNEDMLAAARREPEPPARYRRGESSATGLPDASVDLCTAAQAFHWFDVPATMRELARILRPNGRAAAFWNVRARTPAMDEYDALLRRYSSEYARMRSPEQTLAAIRIWPGARDLVEGAFDNSQAFDHEGFFGRVYSSSYVVHGVDQKDELDRELEALFARHARDGVLAFAYRVIAIAWRLAS